MHSFERIVLVSMLSSILLWGIELVYTLISGGWLLFTSAGIRLFLLVSFLLFIAWGALAVLAQCIYIATMKSLHSWSAKRLPPRSANRFVSIITTATVLPYIIYFNQQLFSGEGISKFTYVGYLRVGFYFIGVLVVFILSALIIKKAKTWFSRENRFRRNLAILFGLGGLIFLYTVNAELYVGQYDFVHQAVSLCMFLIAEFVVINLLGGKRLMVSPLSGAMRSRLYIAFLLPFGICIFAFTGGGISVNNHQLAYIYSRTHLGKQLVWIYNLRAKVELADARYYEEYLVERNTFLRSAPPLKRKGYNFIWIMVDALRADHLPMYGYKRNTSPNLKALAAKSVLFLHNYTQGPNTVESVRAQMTGCFTSTIKKGGGIKKFDTLAEILLRNGYHTWAVAQPLDIKALNEKGREGVIFEKICLPKGKDRVFSAPQVNKKAIELLEERDKKAPFFLSLFYYEVHEPYEKHTGFDYGNGAEDHYDSEISYVDKHIGELLAYLKQEKIQRNTIMLITADHGDEIGLHGGWGHRYKLYDCLIHVPFILYIPGVKPMVVSTPIQSIDMCPSMVELLDLKTIARFDGTSFLPYITKAKPPYNPQIFSEAEWEHSKEVSLIYYPWKLVYHISDSYFELFNLNDDPNEQVNRISDSPAIAALLKKKLLSWLYCRDRELPTEKEVKNVVIKNRVNRLRLHDITALNDLDDLAELEIDPGDFKILVEAITPYFSSRAALFLVEQAMKNKVLQGPAIQALNALVTRTNDIIGGSRNVGEALGSSPYEEAITILNRLSDDKYMSLFLWLVSQGEGALLENCLNIIGVLRPQSCKDKLFALYQGESEPEKKLKIFRCLCKLGDPRVEDELFEMVEGVDGCYERNPMIPLFGNFKSQRCRNFLLDLPSKNVWYRYSIVVEIGKARNTFMLPILKEVFCQDESKGKLTSPKLSFAKKMAILHFVNIKGKQNLDTDDIEAIKKAYENDASLSQYDEIRELYEKL